MGFKTEESSDDTTDIGASKSSSYKKSENKEIYFPFKKSYPKPSPENPEIHVSELVYASREILKVYGMKIYSAQYDQRGSYTKLLLHS